jgi:uncharacterized phage-associated protein
MYQVSDIADCVIAIAHDNKQDVDKLKLQKLLYYIQGAALALTGEPLFEDEILAWKHGPVVYSIYNKYKNHEGNTIEYNPSYENKIDEIDFLLIKEVYKKYSRYSGWELAENTHKEDPWKNAEQSDVISNDEIKAYFKANVYNDKGLENTPIVSVLPSEWHNQKEDAYWETQYLGKV